ncbi:YczE/YyaS/YitT family protein [Paenibacillus sp. FSL H7-0918]|uniref:YczE/YyaS/YitT family protein n=1 Tax=Paenibacillus sp. FSL H7-0918 TaxID=2921442 RepID=UPI0030FC3344
MKKFSVTTFSIFTCGIFILTLGVSLTIISDLGASPFDALLVGLSKNVGLTAGSWEVLIACLLIGCNSCLSKQRPELLGLVTAFIAGLGIDMWLFLFNHLIEPNLWISKIAFYGLGLIAIGLGTSIYLYANFAPIPVDRLTLVLQTITRLSILFTRTIIYLVFLFAAIIFNGPIGIGTLLTICLGGLILNYFMPLTQKVLDRLLQH